MPIPKAMTSGQAHSQKERLHDLYETPPVATHALMRAVRLPRVLWEAASGPGAITRELRAAGHEVLSTDLIDYGSPDQDITGLDFLQVKEAPPIGIEAIVTNPPFHLAKEFIEVGLSLVPKVIVLLRLSFLEGGQKGRGKVMDHLAEVHVLIERLPMMHREGWTGKKANSTQGYAWYVFDRLHTGPAELHRISWKESAWHNP